MSWFGLSLIGLLGFGVQSFLFKIAATRKLRSQVIVFWFALCTAIPLWIYIACAGPPFAPTPFVLLLASLDAFAYYLSSVARLEALRFIPAHLAFLILRGNIIIVLLYDIFVLEHSVRPTQYTAILLFGVTAILIAIDQSKDRLLSQHYEYGLLLIAIATCGSAGAHIVTKYAGEAGQIIEYMALANAFICVLIVAQRTIWGPHELSLPSRSELLIAIASGTCNLVAWIATLYAMRMGSLTATSFVVGMSFLIPITLSALVHSEQLSVRRITAILLAVLGLWLIKG